MEWTLCLVGVGIDGQSPSFEVMAISRPDGLGDIASLGLTLAEAKRLLAQVQQQLVAEQATTHAAVRPYCRSCGGTCQVKDWAPHRIATLFGEVRLKLPRLLCAGCGCGATGVNWPSHCRSTPELNRLQARLSALMPFRVAADVLQHLLPIDDTVRTVVQNLNRPERPWHAGDVRSHQPCGEGAHHDQAAS
jgi:hypothetical protein